MIPASIQEAHLFCQVTKQAFVFLPVLYVCIVFEISHNLSIKPCCWCSSTVIFWSEATAIACSVLTPISGEVKIQVCKSCIEKENTFGSFWSEWCGKFGSFWSKWCGKFGSHFLLLIRNRKVRIFTTLCLFLTT